MKILRNDNSLDSYLRSLRDKTVTIVSAFASGTEDVVKTLLRNSNKLELIIGTINSFSSPFFIDFCSGVDDEGFKFYVDFGYQNSTHWKLYLIDPNIVIIGSANFTITGLSLSRDTCVVIEDVDLFNSYIKDIALLKQSISIVNVSQKEFTELIKSYRQNHRRMQAGLARATQFNGSLDWLNEEANQLIPLLIWDSMHSKKTIKTAYELFESDCDESAESGMRDFFTYECNEDDLPYEQGDVVLCANSKGSYIDFYTFDRILHKNGMNYMFSYKRKRYSRPFRLDSEIKIKIKSRVGDWYENDLKELSRNEIRSLL